MGNEQLLMGERVNAEGKNSWSEVRYTLSCNVVLLRREPWLDGKDFLHRRVYFLIYYVI